MDYILLHHLTPNINSMTLTQSLTKFSCYRAAIAVKDYNSYSIDKALKDIFYGMTAIENTFTLSHR